MTLRSPRSFGARARSSSTRCLKTLTPTGILWAKSPPKTMGDGHALFQKLQAAALVLAVVTVLMGCVPKKARNAVEVMQRLQAQEVQQAQSRWS